jgi:hypothetical protein
MESTRPAPSQTARILRFERPGGHAPPAGGHRATLRVPNVDPSPVDSLEKYESEAGEADEFRHRQWANLATFAACVALVIAGVWIATTMANLQRDQNCVLAGGRNCAQLSITGQAR